MPRSKTATCTVCAVAMWTGTGSTTPDRMVCLPCRRARAGREAEARRIALTFRACTDCGNVFEKSRWSNATSCAPCRYPRCAQCDATFRPALRAQVTCSRLCSTQLRGLGQTTKPWSVAFPTCTYCGDVYAARSTRHLHRRESCRLEHQRAATAAFVRRWTEATGQVTASGLRQPELTYEQRLHSRYVVLESGCWQWIGTFNGWGYGSIMRPDGCVGAHRAMWEDRYGPVPAGLQLDHLCHNDDDACTGGHACLHRGCVNPDHLEPVTPENHSSRTAIKRKRIDRQSPDWSPPLSPRHRPEDFAGGPSSPLTAGAARGAQA